MVERADPPLDPLLMQFIQALARDAARRDHAEAKRRRLEAMTGRNAFDDWRDRYIILNEAVTDSHSNWFEDLAAFTRSIELDCRDKYVTTQSWNARLYGSRFRRAKTTDKARDAYKKFERAWARLGNAMATRTYDSLPRIEAVSAEDPGKLRITWRGRNDAQVVDISDWITTGGEMLSGLRDPDVFSKPQVANYGTAVCWNDGQGDLAIDAVHLAQLAGRP